MTTHQCLNHPNFLIACAKPSALGISVAKPRSSILYYIRDFILFQQKRHPREMGVPELRASYYLAVDKKMAASTQNVAPSALLVLYR
ncbi:MULTISPECIES: phage integrase N-terminal SAM-like domain-containing protein [Limnospira]|uniref:phage integrase N-terminal SAM-like domain-containing protein n=1 Tax=Limnospira TaxID=2596745 RepID=UPI0032AF1C57